MLKAHTWSGLQMAATSIVRAQMYTTSIAWALDVYCDDTVLAGASIIVAKYVPRFPI